jgi:biotin operon repressor
MAKKSQKQKILEYLETGCSITQEEAYKYFKVWRLSAVIKSLKEDGYNIKSVPERHDGGIHARYSLEGSVL